MRRKILRTLGIAALAITAYLAASVDKANADSFQITAQLTGDIRADSPDGLIVDVTIDVVDDVATWTVNINSPSHPNIKLDEFYFNLAILAADVTFSDFNPSGWTINSPATVQGAGGTTFEFEAQDPAGPPNADDVTNSVNLTFKATLNRDWTEDDFLDAVVAQSNDAGSGQLGAHLQSLTVNSTTCPPSGDCSDSGFAFGNYEGGGDDNGSGGSGNPIPEPGTVLLLGSGLVALGLLRRKQMK